ncbi:MAG: NAD(P)H-dependent FMN reductase, partial [Bradymonadia bacterium]
GFKSLYDWCSRIDSKVWQGKPMVLLATSPGGRGGAGVLKAASDSAPFFGGDLKATLAVPKFHENFDAEVGVLSNEELRAQLQSAVDALVAGS